ncbi:hypothetical protein [Methylocella tundrae]|uniref:Cupin 2 conserved barrel domain-containing protein n=1 Tax=Methylocella tundrae TaxID=227605 RepID=A0A4U8Z403_METTU|nr:hypothetical protein [Methylocella tundrae]WPP03829.1 hypothetical protein SIN04_15370 [Methylocella tundrae]VFU10011.1 conserved protein of unknown function [Methylocella tundrae]
MSRCVRLYSGTDGQSHVEELEWPVGEKRPVRLVHIEESPPGSALDWHVAPCEQYVVTLLGMLEFTTRDGETFILAPGDVLLADDTTGSGHRWRLIDASPWRRMYVEFVRS